MNTVADTPAVALAMLPVTVELNCVRLTVASGSADLVDADACVQPWVTFDHIPWRRY